MGLTELLLLAVGLSMDAFAVSVCKGLAVREVRPRHMLLAGLWFGGFQALMPLLGYLLGAAFAAYINLFDHWLAFGLLAFIGAKMIKDAVRADDDAVSASFGCRTMCVMAVATSIDALAVGVTFALLPDVNFRAAVLTIGLVTFLFSAAGVKIGHIFGARYRAGAELTGGIILIGIGLKILLEHLGLLAL